MDSQRSKTKNATPITDLMAYHLSQLSEEFGAGKPLEPALAEAIDRVLADTERLNAGADGTLNADALASQPSETTDTLVSSAATRLTVEWTAAWESVVDSILRDVGFVWTDADEGAISFLF
jgi:hypothetical protein